VQLLDKALRAAALVTCVAAGFAVVLMGGFAADSGTRTADLTGMAIILGVGSLLLGVVLACFMKGRFATAVAYGVGCIGIGLGVLQGARVWLWGSAFQEVAPGTANYPVLNPHPAWTVQVAGELAPAVSLEYLEATYIVGFAMSDEPPECHSAASHGGLPYFTRSGSMSAAPGEVTVPSSPSTNFNQEPAAGICATFIFRSRAQAATRRPRGSTRSISGTPCAVPLAGRSRHRVESIFGAARSVGASRKVRYARRLHTSAPTCLGASRRKNAAKVRRSGPIRAADRYR
jgi:hypothetical protein